MVRLAQVFHPQARRASFYGSAASLYGGASTDEVREDTTTFTSPAGIYAYQTGFGRTDTDTTSSTSSDSEAGSTSAGGGAVSVLQASAGAQHGSLSDLQAQSMLRSSSPAALRRQNNISKQKGINK